MKDSYTQIASLCKPSIKPFLDEKKVLFSFLYSQALAHCIEHAEKHSDLRLLGVMVDLFETRDYKVFVSNWICERLGLKTAMGPSGAVFKKTGASPNTLMSFKVSLEKFAAGKFKINSPTKPPVVKEKKAPKRVDMLDSWARLPGSYGHGKR